MCCVILPINYDFELMLLCPNDHTTLTSGLDHKDTFEYC